jgi:hypothetical protein
MHVRTVDRALGLDHVEPAVLQHVGYPRRVFLPNQEVGLGASTLAGGGRTPNDCRDFMLQAPLDELLDVVDLALEHRDELLA